MDARCEVETERVHAAPDSPVVDDMSEAHYDCQTTDHEHKCTSKLAPFGRFLLRMHPRHMIGLKQPLEFATPLKPIQTDRHADEEHWVEESRDQAYAGMVRIPVHVSRRCEADDSNPSQ